MANSTLSLKMNSLALRQTAESKYSHFAGSSSELIQLLQENWDRGTQGYKPGVLVIPVPADRFYSGVVEVTPETPLKAEFSARRKGEDAYLQISSAGRAKALAKFVEVVVYSHDTLAQDASTDAAWEVVSINARPTEQPEPQTPVAMARNFLGLSGGTKAEYTPEQFAQAIIYWSTRVMCG